MRQIARRQSQPDFLSGRERREAPSSLARHERQQSVAVRQFHPVRCFGQHVHHSAFDFKGIISGHVRISGSDPVMSTVCSKWADSEPSCVTTVQLSFNNFTSGKPALTIGSIAMVMPGFNLSRHFPSTKLGTCGSSWTDRPTPCPTNSRTTLNLLLST